MISQSRTRNGRERKENREGWAWEKSNVVSAMIVPSSRARAFQLISGKPLFFFKFILVIPFARRDYDAASTATLQLICIDSSMQKEEDPAALRPSLFVWRQGINPPKWRDTTSNGVETRLFLAAILQPSSSPYFFIHLRLPPSTLPRGKRYNLGILVRFSIPRSRIVSSPLLNIESLSLQRRDNHRVHPTLVLPSFPFFFFFPSKLPSIFLFCPLLLFLYNPTVPRDSRLNDFAQRFSRVRAPITPYPSVILVIEATLVFVS